MGGCFKGCLGRVVALVVLALGAWLGWRYAPADWRERAGSVWSRVERSAGGGGPEEDDGLAATPELADVTLDKVERFRAESAAGERLVLGGDEVSSVVRYALPGILPPGVTEPAVEMNGGRIILSARVAVAAFPELPSLEEIVGLLPDTVPIRMAGSLGPRDASSATLFVDAVQAVRIPLPDRFIPEILRALGRKDQEGLPPHAMVVPLPRGLRAAYVSRDSLVLVADR